YAANVVCKLVAQVTGLVAHLGVARAQFFLEPDRSENYEGDGNECHPPYLRRREHEEPAHDEDGDSYLDEVVGTPVEEPFKLIYVVIEDGNESPRRGVLEVRDFEPLEPRPGS